MAKGIYAAMAVKMIVKTDVKNNMIFVGRMKMIKDCLNCKHVKNIQTVITGFKCRNENSNMYGEYVDENFSCKKWEGNEKTPEDYLKEKVNQIQKENKFNYWRNICEIQAEQTAKGLIKYGYPLEQNTWLNIIERLRYLEEELIDGLMYIEHIKALIEGESMLKELNVCYDSENNIKCATSYEDWCQSCSNYKNKKTLKIKDLLEDK